ncbi:MAG: DotU family type IV/VI secretion system protein [Deltaproteobacteria bacterium]|jgi:hypothetical protein|nr:DotU family type IV/VI secretion system protein [Deltaproteobacteria bacterium]
MRQVDYFNEAIVTAMLAIGAGLSVPPARRAVPEPDAGTAANVPRARDGEDGGSDLTRAPTLHGCLVSLLDGAARRCTADGLSREYAETADFAVCAFIDEILLSSAWAGRREWMDNPLQLVRHDTATAGEEFYRVLDLLLEKAEKLMPGGGMSLFGVQNPQWKENTEQRALQTVLEIFALCLTQGFTGRLFGNAAAITEKLVKIGRFVPPLKLGQELETSAEGFPAARTAASLRKNSFAGLRRYDFLDVLLWLTPPLVTGLAYYLYDSRLNLLLEAFTKGNGLP